jgi:hypothetical protein
MALAEQNAHINTEKAAHALGTNESWDKMWSQLQTDSHTSAESRAYSDKLANVAGSEWGKVLNDKSSFANNLTQDPKKQLQAYGGGGAGVNIGIKADGGGRYIMTATGDEGKILSFSVDESTANSIKESMSSVRERAVSETFGDSKGLQFATNLASRIGATEAASYLKEASNMTRTTETTGVDATTAFVGWYASDRYGSDSSENIDKAGAALNHMATGGSAGMNQLQSHQQRFLKSGNYTWGDGQAQVNDTINATRSEVCGGMANVQGQVGPGATVAGIRTDSINPGGFGGNPGDNHDPLVVPQEEGNVTLRNAEDLRDSHKKDFEEFRMLPKTGSPE